MSLASTQPIRSNDQNFSINLSTDLNFLELRSTKLSVFKLNFSAFHFTFHLLFGHAFHVHYQRTGACHIFDLLCNQSSLPFYLSDGSTKVLYWLIFWFLRLFTFNFIYENKFRFTNEFKRQAHICKFALPWTKNNPTLQALSLTSSFEITKIVSLQFLHYQW